MEAKGERPVMSTEPNRFPTGVSNGEEVSAEIQEEWMPFLETYEQALRRGDARTPEQWLSDHPQLPKDLHGNLEQLYWLYGSGERARARPAVVEAPLPSISGYEVLEVLGRGGMGVVYRAWQKSLKRFVALKMLKDGVLADEESRQRFRREAEAAARLRHPHIIQVYEIGEQDGRPFFALEYVEGGSLAEKVRGTPQPPGEAARLVETLARTMSHAHQQGIVHRDLKPSNVLVIDEADTPLGQWVPKITDFGLAKQVHPTAASAGPQTQSGAIVGTAEYMSPEQAAGLTKVVGPAADIYSLGAMLYELLTGRSPFKGATLVDTVQQVLHDEPVSPRRLQPKVPHDLETICLKCLHKEPNKRYASAQDLADDLRQFQDGKPIQARPIGTWERGVKWAKRRPTAAALAVVSVSFVLILGIVLARLNMVLRKEVEESNLQRAREAEYFRKAAEIAHNASRTLWSMGKPREALDLENQLIDLLESGLQQGLLTDSQRTVALPAAYFVRAGLLAEMGQHEKAVEDFDRALELKVVLEAKLLPAHVLEWRMCRVQSLILSGQYERAVAEAEALAEEVGLSGADPYNLALVYSMSITAVRKDAKLSPEEKESKAEDFGARALELLIRAQAAGFFKDPVNIEQLRKDPDLNPLREQPAFKKLLNDLEPQAKPKAP
jgi:serine/threonine protein kinase